MTGCGRKFTTCSRRSPAPYALDERHDDVQARLERAAVAAKALEHAGASLGNDANRSRRDEQRHDDKTATTISATTRAPLTRQDERSGALISTTSTCSPLDLAIVVKRARGPNLTADLDGAEALVVGDPSITSAGCPINAAVPCASPAADADGASRRAQQQDHRQRHGEERHRREDAADPCDAAQDRANAAPSANGAR